MHIKINGKQETVTDGVTVNELLLSKNMRPEVVTVEINGSIIARTDYDITLKEGDIVEFVFYMGGGIL